MSFDVLPAASAALNAAAGALLLVGRARIRRGDVAGHRRAMLGALGVSAAFLATYVAHHAIHSLHSFGGEGAMRTAYRVILGSHTVLAVAVAVMAPWTAWLGLRDRRAAHRRLARWTYPIWLYVSATGIVVYAMLYHLWPDPGTA